MIRRYDYTSIKNRLTTLIQEKDDAQSWKDMWESSTGLIFIEMLASGEEHLGYYLERRVIENYINTAILQSSVYNLAAEKGYVPGRKLAAAANARLVFDVPVTEALVIPRGSVLDASNPVSTFDDYAVSVGNTEIGIGDGSSAYFSATLAKMEECYGQSVTGHTHTPAILRAAWQVGCTERYDVDYVSGPSSWLHASCLVYPNGSRQMINSIGGNWRLTEGSYSMAA